MFRRLNKSSLHLLPLLWVGWLLLAGCVFIIVTLLNSYWGDWASIQSELRYLTLADFWILLMYLSPIAVILGSLHYLVLRLLGKRNEGVSVRKESLGGIAMTLVLVMALGFFVWQHKIEDELYADLHRYDSEKYEVLATAGHYESLVRMMELDCARFEIAKQKLENEECWRVGACGFSYTFVYLYPAFDSTKRLAPPGIINFVQLTRSDDGKSLEYGDWRPIAEALSKSETQVLRVFGYFLIDKNHPKFVEAAYALADKDADANILAAHASFADQDLQRSIKRMLQYDAKGEFKTWEDAWNRSYVEETMKSKVSKALDLGVVDESLKAQLRKQPWVRKLSLFHQQALGLEVIEH